MNVDKKLYPYFFITFFTLLVIANGAFFYFTKEDKQIVKGENKIAVRSDKEMIIPEPAKNDKRTNLKIEKGDYLLNKSEGNIEVIIYDDPSEPFAPRYYEVIKQIEKEFGDKAKIALRLLPLEVIENSDIYDSLVLCAGEQGKYFEAYEQVLKANTEHRLTTESIFSILKELGLDMDQLKKCQSSEALLSKMNAIKTEADENAIIGVPSTFINNLPFPGAYQMDDFVDSAGYKREGLRTVIQKQLTINN